LFEMKVAKMTTKILHLEVKRDSRSGAGLHKQDARDRYNLLPISIECKDHAVLNVKQAWREADAKSSYGQAPVVVFPDDSETLCVMRYSDMLQFIKEMMDWKETAEDLRTTPLPVPNPRWEPSKLETQPGSVRIKPDVEPLIEKKIERGSNTCRAGHIADEWGYCSQKDCQYRRGYVKKKVKK
jgi:hypothetical protein